MTNFIRPFLKNSLVFLLFHLIYCTVDHRRRRQHSSPTEGIKWRSLTPHVSSHFSATLPRLRKSQLVQRTLWPKLRGQASFHLHVKLFNSIPQSALTPETLKPQHTVNLPGEYRKLLIQTDGMWKLMLRERCTSNAPSLQILMFRLMSTSHKLSSQKDLPTG